MQKHLAVATPFARNKSCNHLLCRDFAFSWSQSTSSSSQLCSLQHVNPDGEDFIQRLCKAFESQDMGAAQPWQLGQPWLQTC